MIIIRSIRPMVPPSSLLAEVGQIPSAFWHVRVEVGDATFSRSSAQYPNLRDEY